MKVFVANNGETRTLLLIRGVQRALNHSRKRKYRFSFSYIYLAFLGGWNPLDE